MPEMVTTMVLKVDLGCCKCYKKVKNVLSKFPQIRDQVYDEKQNTVTIKVVCCDPEKLRDKLCCKGGGSITSIGIKQTEKPQTKPQDELQSKGKPQDELQSKGKPQNSPPKVSVPLPTCCPQTSSPFGPCCSECYSGRVAGRLDITTMVSFYGCTEYDSCQCGCSRRYPGRCGCGCSQRYPGCRSDYCGCGCSQRCNGGCSDCCCEENPTACTIM